MQYSIAITDKIVPIIREEIISRAYCVQVDDIDSHMPTKYVSCQCILD